jgi:Fe(3+) dicitrate transport protein
MRLIAGLLLFLLSSVVSFSQVPQNPVDTTSIPKSLSDITVVGRYSTSDIQLLPEVVGTSIYAGKKSSLVVVNNVKGNVANNTMRQVVAKVPGMHIWESDGSGIQIGIAARGLSPNRSWEFNVRQNGYDISADPYGYPEAYYNPQLQAVQRIEIIRGHGALQYGPQFGGLVNYIIKNGSEIEVPFEAETQQTVGSNGLFNSYNAVGGRKEKLHYYTFFDHRNANGYRPNSRYFTNAGFGTITYSALPGLSITLEVMTSHIRSQQPGGLTDRQLDSSIKQSHRSRNWFDIRWTTTALITNYQITQKHKLNIKVFTIQGDRNSVGFMPSGGIVVADTINKLTNAYNPRNLNIDNYKNYGMELRYLGQYKLLGLSQTISSGLRFFKGNTFRYVADGKGSTGIDYDMSMTGNVWTRDLDFKASNAAVFVENLIQVTDKLSLVPGIRYEYLVGSVAGRNGFSGINEILLQPQQRARGFVLAGVGVEYHTSPKTEIYVNISQAYRPIQFADLSAPPTTDEIDQNLKDAKGFNADFGFRGKLWNFLLVDASIYWLQYNNRIGVIVQQRQDGSFYNFRTNVGNSVAKGFEGLVEANLGSKLFSTNTKWKWSLFTSYSLNDVRYQRFSVVAKNASGQLLTVDYSNKKVENAPTHILRTGTTVSFAKTSFTTQLSYVGDSFGDANNTLKPSANAQNGLIPSYAVIDLTLVHAFNKQYDIRAGVNNLFNKYYFTRRAGGYPGPGALPADGRTFFLTFTAKFK